MALHCLKTAEKYGKCHLSKSRRWARSGTSAFTRDGDGNLTDVGKDEALLLFFRSSFATMTAKCWVFPNPRESRGLGKTA